MLESLLSLTQETDFLSRAYDYLIGEVGWRNWFDIVGGGIVLYSGVKRSTKHFFYGVGVAVTPEFFYYLSTENTSSEGFLPSFGKDAGVDLLGAALVYGLGSLVIRPWIDRRRSTPSDGRLPPPSRS